MEEICMNKFPIQRSLSRVKSINICLNDQKMNQRRIKRSSIPTIQKKSSKILSSKNTLYLLMIKIKLQSQFNEKQFNQISSVSPQKWLKFQKDLWNQLISTSFMYEKYFQIFYQNHVKLCNWYHLATKDKICIGEYVFKQLLCKKKQEHKIIDTFNNQTLKRTFQKQKSLKNINIDDYQQQIYNQNNKDLQIQNYNKSAQRHRRKQSLDYKISQYKTQNDPNNQQIQMNSMRFKKHHCSQLSDFSKQNYGIQMNNLIDNNKQQSSYADTKSTRKPLNLKQYRLKKLSQQITDPHQLYMTTFEAYNCKKYISYDYEKHQKGQNETKKYNDYLKNNKSTQNQKLKLQLERSSNNGFLNNKVNLKNFQQFDHYKQSKVSKQKYSLLAVNMVINGKNQSIMKRIKQIINHDKSNKIVFINHQRKPITYYIKNNKQIMDGGILKKQMHTIR